MYISLLIYPTCCVVHMRHGKTCRYDCVIHTGRKSAYVLVVNMCVLCRYAVVGYVKKKAFPHVYWKLGWQLLEFIEDGGPRLAEYKAFIKVSVI